MSRVLLLAVLVMVTACAGRTASPVMATQYDDRNLSCEEMQSEIRGIELKIHELLPQTDKMQGKNAGLAVAGLFFFPAWFFMDLSNAEKIEVEAFKVRYEHLSRLEKRQCNG